MNLKPKSEPMRDGKDTYIVGMTKNERRAFLLGQIELSEKLIQFTQDGILILKRELEELEKAI